MSARRWLLRIGFALLFLQPGPGWGRPVEVVSIEQISHAPVLVVGRVTRIIHGPELPGKNPRRVEHRVAEVEVLRWFTADEETRKSLEAGHDVRIAHYGYAAGGGPDFDAEFWPEIAVGDVRLFPLRAETGESGARRLLAEEAMGILAPARRDLAAGIAAGSSLRFVIREVANSLASGDPRDIHEAAVYLRDTLGPNYQDAMFSDSLTTLVSTTGTLLAGDQQRQVELAAGLLASFGIPRPTVAEFLAEPFDSEQPRSRVHRLTSWALQTIPTEVRQRELIATLVRNSSVYAWGAAVSLAEFAEEPFLVSELSAALRQRQPGALYVASWAINHGQQGLLADTMPYAMDRIDPPDGDNSELVAACQLLRDRGNGPHFAALLAAIRKYQSTDLERYRRLWNCAVFSESNPREMQVLILFLPDRRVAFGDFRFRDLAAERLQQLSGQNFGFNAQQAAGSREAAAVKAEAWLAEQVRLGKIPPPD